MISEQNIDDSFPDSHSSIDRYSTLYRIDGNRNGGGILFFVRMRNDIPSNIFLLKSYQLKAF